MEILLLGVTGVSLLVAAVMGLAAWRLSIEERARATARVAALAAAAGDEAPRQAPRPAPAKAAAVAAANKPVVVAAPASTGGDFMREEMWMSDGFLGATPRPVAAGRQRVLAFAAIALFAVVLGGGYWTVFGERRTPESVTASAAGTSPLELVSLRHERRGVRLEVTGLVRNPAGGAPVDKLAAVVFLFDPQGGFISSARADIDFLKLAPGDESPFVISVEAPSNVARYRVSFRTEAGVVPHIDRRGQEPIATSAVGPNASPAR